MVLPQFWDRLSGVFSLNIEAFQQIATSTDNLWSALLVVLFAGLSLGIGQSIILFINRVRPIRFVFSLLLNGILFTCGFLCLVLSTWLICLLSGSVNISLNTLFKVLGFSYAPQLFSFLGALPYAGLPILQGLSVWRLLAAVVGLAAVAGVSGATAFGYVGLGWFTLQFLENTTGQPIAKLGQAIADRVAGVNLAVNRTELQARVQAGRGVASPIVTPAPGTIPEINQLVEAAGRSAPEAAQAAAQSIISQADSRLHLEPKTKGIAQAIKLWLSLLGMVVVFVAIALLLQPIRAGLVGTTPYPESCKGF
ncbi:MAG: hypothetical protein KME35_06125 [Aphanocapsa sp. GSE-SYN-MK-11-07L]|nr:hypothetical protein [Aphanocapsa sp. GSE-SYN-MK-11-07L]